MADVDKIQVSIDPASISQALHKRIAEIAIGEEIAKAIASACQSYKVKGEVEEAVKRIVSQEVSAFVRSDEKTLGTIKALIAEKITGEVLEKLVDSVWKSAESRW
jgi:hypothetical protein